MARKRTKGLTEREAEIMAVLWEKGAAGVEDIRLELAGSPSANAVRTLLTIMAERGLVTDDGLKYGKKYKPLIKISDARGSALRRLIDSFFSGSTEEMLVQLVDDGEVNHDLLKRLQKQLRKKEK